MRQGCRPDGRLAAGARPTEEREGGRTGIVGKPRRTFSYSPVSRETGEDYPRALVETTQ